MRTALTIAGSDSGAGAGMQADLKTFAALGVYGTSAVTAVTAQNTCGVHASHPVPPAIVTAQIDAIAPDIGVDAAKTGMLATTAIVEAVAEAVWRHRIPNLVVDPVILASSGDRLLAADAVTVLTTTLLPRARVVTPNVHEAEVLAGIAIRTTADRQEAARRIVGFGARAVIITGGHLPTSDISDLLFDGDQFTEYRTPREPGRSTHGTGCAFSAALAAYLALGHPLHDAVVHAQAFVAGAIRHGIDRGRGKARPMDHFWRTTGDPSPEST
jgi:hydroxymethylpyrimidine/phosphomethylpyrimidine kinase